MILDPECSTIRPKGLGQGTTMAEAALRIKTTSGEVEALRWDDVVRTHDAVLRCSEYTREAAWTRFLDALYVFLGGSAVGDQGAKLSSTKVLER